MAASMNKVILIGRLGQDPKLSYTTSGQAVAELSVATDESYQKDGQWVDATEWHRVKIWREKAERCANYLSKGRLVLVEGKLQTRAVGKGRPEALFHGDHRHPGGPPGQVPGRRRGLRGPRGRPAARPAPGRIPGPGRPAGGIPGRPAGPAPPACRRAAALPRRGPRPGLPLRSRGHGRRALLGPPPRNPAFPARRACACRAFFRPDYVFPGDIPFSCSGSDGVLWLS